MSALTKRASGITQTGWTSPANAYDAGTATFASWASIVALATNTIYLTGYDFASGIPSTAGLTSVSFTVKQYVSATNRMLAPQVQPYVGATPKGTVTTLTNSATTTNSQTVTITGLTMADIRDATFQVQFIARHYNGTISGTQFLDFIDVVVDYAPLAAPTSRTLTAASQSATSVLLSWNADPDAFPVPTYTVEQSTNGTSFSTVASGLSGTSYTVTGLTEGTLYYFRLVGTNSQGSATSNTATATPVSWSLRNTFEGGTDETVIGSFPNLSGPDPLNLFYQGTIAGQNVYDTLRAKFGTVSMRTQVTSTAGQSSMGGWTFTATPKLPFYFRTYMFVPSSISANTRIIRIGDSADTRICDLTLNTTNTLSFGLGTLATTTSTISLNTWIRVEGRITSTGATLRLFNSVDSTTATQEVTSSTTYTAVGNIRFGLNTAALGEPAIWWDNIYLSDSDWIGPEISSIVGYWGIKFR